MPSVVEQLPYSEHTANGIATVFGYEFQLLAATDLVVTADGVTVSPSDYTVAGIGAQGGGDITFVVAPPASGVTILLSREIALERDTDYQYAGDFREETIDRDLNRLWQALQGLSANLGGAVRLAYPQQATALPDMEDRLLAFDLATGQPEPSTFTQTQMASAIAAAYAAGSTADAVTYLPEGTGASSRSVQAALRELDVYVTNFAGVVGDGGATDSTAGLALAVAHVNNLCDIVTDPVYVARFPRLIFPPSLGFKTTATLSIRAGVEVIMHSPLLVAAAASAPIVGIDMIDSKGVNYEAPRGISPVFMVRRLTQSNWGSENDIGVRIPALYMGTPYFKQVIGFTVGVNACLGYGQPKFGDIRDCKKGAIITARGSPENFTNQFKALGGSFNCGGGIGVGLARYGIVLLGTSPGGANTLVFDGQSYELNKAVAGGSDAIPVLVDGTAANVTSVRFINQRSEANGGTFARLVGAVRGVEIGVLDGELEYTYPTSSMLDDQSTGGGANVLYRHLGASAPHWQEFFNTGKLSERCVQLTGSAFSAVNMEAMTNAGAAPTPPVFSATGGLAAFDTSGYMTSTGPYYGVRVRLRGARSFAISGLKPTATAADLVMTCFNSAGAQITTAGAVQCEQSNANLNTAIYGGLYSVGVNPSNNAPAFDAVLSFASTVATVFIAVATKVDGWVLKRSDARPEWFSSTSHMREQFVGAAIPVALTNVTYKQGMRVAQLTSTVGQPKGWVCTAPGVPTFVSEGNL